ncbi:hypothetical protein DOY81_002449, partial [Sarcophaga bullata]
IKPANVCCCGKLQTSSVAFQTSTVEGVSVNVNICDYLRRKRKS